MRTWHSCMSAASQAAFVVIPKKSMCEMFYIKRTLEPSACGSGPRVLSSNPV